MSTTDHTGMGIITIIPEFQSITIATIIVVKDILIATNILMVDLEMDIMDNNGFIQFQYFIPVAYNSNFNFDV